MIFFRTLALNVLLLCLASPLSRLIEIQIVVDVMPTNQKKNGNFFLKLGCW